MLLDDAALDDVPVFPLPQVVLFPDARLPLHVFEPRYRAMLADCLAGTKTMVIAQVQRNGTRIAEVAGVGVVEEHRELSDGRSNIVVAGRARVRLEELVLEDPPRYPYKRAKVTRLSDVDAIVGREDSAALVAVARMFAAEVKKHDPTFEFRLPEDVSIGGLADTCAFHLVVDAAVRQAVLEELDPRVRVRMVMDQLALQHGSMISEKPGRVLN